MKKNSLELAPGLWLIPLDQGLPGFTNFIGAWLFRGPSTVLVDVGPSATIPRLLESLDQLNVTRLDAILLTHIHIDHAGGIGDFAPFFPETPIVCHESAMKHLQDPLRLWEGSVKTLGDKALAYGPIRPVPGARLCAADSYDQYGILPVLTPGHAPHHVSYLIDTYMFAGEAGGVCLQGSQGNDYIRPATPPTFFLETTIDSIDHLMDYPHHKICLGHFGMVDNSAGMLKRHRNQLFQWVDIIKREMDRESDEKLAVCCLHRLLGEDPLLKEWGGMERSVQEREQGFLLNSIRGFIQYLERQFTETD
jgi:glyoxylase-like metal-dependent hydrolase (beta-lactamase superfamily II)